MNRILLATKKLGALYLYGLAMFTLGACLGAAEAFVILATLWGPK